MIPLLAREMKVYKIEFDRLSKKIAGRTPAITGDYRRYLRYRRLTGDYRRYLRYRRQRCFSNRLFKPVKRRSAGLPVYTPDSYFVLGSRALLKSWRFRIKNKAIIVKNRDSHGKKFSKSFNQVEMVYFLIPFV